MRKIHEPNEWFGDERVVNAYLKALEKMLNNPKLIPEDLDKDIDLRAGGVTTFDSEQ